MAFILRITIALGVAFALAACGAETPDRAGTAAQERPVVVYAAASLTDVLKELGDLYAAEGHPPPRFNFAGSSALAKQIEQGGEADVFVSADEAWMDYVSGRRLIDPATRKTLLTNTLVLVAPAGAPFQLQVAPGMDLRGALGGGRLALAEPDSVPAGKYAREALEHFGAWTSIEPDIARTENVRAALRFVETGDAAAGIVYATDARAAGASVLIVAEFPAGSHTPITYPAALLSGQRHGPGEGFLDFLNSPGAEKAFREAGFGMAEATETDAYLPPK